MECCCAHATNNDQTAFLGGFKEKEAFGQSSVVCIFEAERSASKLQPATEARMN
jgi:hypothetical protein